MTDSPLASPREGACDAFVRILSPHLGETMARASVDRHLQTLGLSRDKAAPSDLDQVIGWLAQGLNVFLGRAQTAQVVEQMRQAARGAAQP
jgi:hypothetical protein